MLQSLFKLFCLGCALLGPFGAGIMHQFVVEPEIYAIFVIGGCLLGFGGVCGFASIERDEARRFAAALGRKG
jgi:hypothetical protein